MFHPSSFNLHPFLWQRTLVLALLLSLACGRARAHPLDEAGLYHFFKCDMAASGLTLDYRILVGGLSVFKIWDSIDTDRNKVISEEEKQAFTTRMQETVKATLDDEPLAMKVISCDLPRQEDFIAGTAPYLKLILRAEWRSSAKGGHRFDFITNAYADYTNLYIRPVVEGPGAVKATASTVTEQKGFTLRFTTAASVRKSPSLLSPSPKVVAGGVNPPAGGRFAPAVLVDRTPPKKDANANLPTLENQIDRKGRPSYQKKVSEGHWAAVQPAKKFISSLTVASRDVSSRDVSSQQSSSQQPSLPAKTLVAPQYRPSNAVEAAPSPTLSASTASPSAETVPQPIHSNSKTIAEVPASPPQSRVLQVLRPFLTGSGGALAALGLALLLGMAHALLPGHSKTIVGAYLVGVRGTFGDALLLGGVVTLAHTSVVLLFGLLLWRFERFMPERVQPYLQIASGLLVTGLGFGLLLRALLRWHGLKAESAAPETDAFAFVPRKDTSRCDLLLLGLSGGMVPCADALILLLFAHAQQKTAFGLLLVLAFGAGMAAVLVGIGLVMVKAGNALMKRRSARSERWLRAVPVVSAAVIFGLGLYLTGAALVQYF